MALHIGVRHFDHSAVSMLLGTDFTLHFDYFASSLQTDLVKLEFLLTVDLVAIL